MARKRASSCARVMWLVRALCLLQAEPGRSTSLRGVVAAAVKMAAEEEEKEQVADEEEVEAEPEAASETEAVAEAESEAVEQVTCS